LILAFAALLLGGVGFTSWLLISSSQNTLSGLLGEQARQLAQTLAAAAEAPYLEGNPRKLHHLGKGLLHSRNIVLLVFSDAEGRALAAESRDPAYAALCAQAIATPSGTQALMQVYPRATPALGQFLEVSAPVVSRSPAGGARLLGYITVGVSQSGEQSEIQKATLLGITVGSLVFLVSLPLASGMIRRIFMPIDQLLIATNRIASGHYDARIATDSRPDEIGCLSRSFNAMVERIRDQRQRLHEANDQLERANRELEQKVRQRTRELEAANSRLTAEISEKEDFLRAVSHDLNAPLRNIGGMAAMLLMKHRDRFDEDIIHRLQRIQKNVEIETDLIGELLELSRIKTRRQRMEPLDLGTLVAELAGVFEQDLQQRGIELKIETHLPAVLGERGRLRMVFQNLIDNAIKYMGQGPQRSIRVGHRDPADGEEGVEFYVADTGMGIDPDDLAKVFRVFRRGKNSAAENVPGRGVGLASVKSIIETYDGRIWVESAAGKGSTFRFTLHKRFTAPAQRMPAPQPEAA
jgi:signal transduction histidine kinase